MSEEWQCGYCGESLGDGRTEIADGWWVTITSSSGFELKEAVQLSHY